MLGKLMKHEWKSTYRMGCLVLCSMVLITFLGWLAFQSPMWKAMDGRGSAGGWLDVLSVLTLMLYGMLLACANFGILIYLGVHFYRTMYTDEGYLTHTLPVTKHQILASKILVGGLWMLFVILGVYLSLLFLGLSLVSAFRPDGYSLAYAWNRFLAGLWEGMVDFGKWFEFDMSLWAISALAISLLSPFVTITILFGAISLGQLAARHKLMAGIFCYIAILVTDSLVSSLLRSFSMSIGDYMGSSLSIGFVVNLLTAVALYAVSYFVTSRRLNMG